jgi:hypothetical protein
VAEQTANQPEGNGWLPGSETHLGYLAGIYGITAAEAGMLVKKHGSNRKVLDIAVAKLTGRPARNPKKKGRLSPTTIVQRMEATDEAARTLIESERAAVVERTMALREKRLSHAQTGTLPA